MPIEIGTGISIGGGINFGGGAEPLAPANTVAPAVTGTATQGQTLTVSNGTWSNTPTSYTYQWQHTTTNISGATSSTYVLDATYVGETIRCVVTATNVTGSASATSNATSAVAALASAPVNSSAPVVSGTAVAGQTLTTTNGIWTGSTPITYTYQWQYNGNNNISGATSSTFTPGQEWFTATIRCQVTATNSIGSTSANSNATASLGSSPFTYGTPSISGTVAIGQVLTCATGSWNGSATITYAYQWTRSGANISGATSSTYTLVSGDAGLSIACTVTATNSYGSLTKTTSAVATAGSYPTVSAANEVFKFNYNTLASTPDLIIDNSSHAWPNGQTGGSGGYTGLSQPSGGAYSGSAYYFRNDGTNNNAWLTATAVTGYGTYHNTNVAQSSWAYETNIWIEDVASYNNNTNFQLIDLYGGGIMLSQQDQSSTKYRLFVNFATGIDTGSSNGTQVQCDNLTGGAWKHLVVQVIRTSAGLGKIYCFVNGALQNSGGTDYNFGSSADFWCASSGAKLGMGFHFATPKLAMRLDNTRLILGAPFSIGGFTAPTAAFTA